MTYKFVILLAVLFTSASYAQETPCNKAVQDFKKKCGRFVGEHDRKMNSLGEDPNTCNQRARIARESEQAFEKICGGAAVDARNFCQSNFSQGITGASGSTTMTEDLTDLAHTLNTFKEMFDKNNYTGCDIPTS